MSEQQAPYYVPCPECKGKGEIPQTSQAVDQTAIEYQERIRIAAGFDSQRIAAALFEYVGGRKHAAQRLLKAKPDSSSEQAYKDMIEFMNQKIKQLLAL